MKLIWWFISKNCVSDDANNANHKVLERYFLLKNAPNFPKIINQTTEHIDKISNNLVLSGGLYLNIIKNPKNCFDAPAFPVLVDVEVRTSLPGVCGKYPIVSFAVGKAAITFDKHITNFNFVV